ncbi:hypothetical protein AYI70_g7201 [Smittium culicis]|uniref:Vacuolar protein sorting-associated protein 8 central domain-containing protein n=1 Tax=Smittium culicis TaxID=133412 RepID=A0A1R1XLR4_9FUNG|nr:hypothetical protein AYI70_g7201 [Smittium culicis]
MSENSPPSSTITTPKISLDDTPNSTLPINIAHLTSASNSNSSINSFSSTNKQNINTTPYDSPSIPHSSLTPNSAPPKILPKTPDLNLPSSNSIDFNHYPNLDHEFVTFQKNSKISYLISNPKFTNKVGKPLCFALGSHLAIGSNLGFVYVLDFSPTVKVVLGKQCPYFGLVTSLVFSADNSRLLAGYSQGYIVVWSWEAAKIEAIIKPCLSLPSTQNAHLFDSPISLLSFIGISRHRFISGDPSGRVIHHQIIDTVVFSKLKSYILYDPPPPLDNSLSFLLEIEPLPYSLSTPKINELGIVSLLLNDRLLLYQTKPSPSLLFQKRYSAKYSSNSYPNSISNSNSATGSISWLPANSSNNLNFLSILAFANGSSISLYYLKNLPLENGNFQINLVNFFNWSAPSEVASINWIDSTIFSIITTDNSVYAVDYCSRIETKIFSLSSISILSQPWIAIRLGLSLKGSLRYSVIKRNQKFYLLTSDSIYSFSLKPWTDRIVWLMNEGRFVEAIALCNGLYKGDSGQIVLGLPHNLHDLQLFSPPISFDNLSDDNNSLYNPDIQRHSLIGPKLASLVQASLKFVFSAKYAELSNSININTIQSKSRLLDIYNVQNIDSVLKSLLVVCVEACIATNQLNFLLNDTFEQVSTFPNAELIFLEVLEPFIENGIISSVSPIVLQALVKSYSEDHIKRQKLEECLLYINLNPVLGAMDIDIDGLLSTCTMWKMWKALFRIWIDILRDPVKPLIDMFSHLSSFISEFSLQNSPNILCDDNWTSSHNVLSYESSVLFSVLENTLCGLSYPLGVPITPTSTAVLIASSVISLLTTPSIQPQSLSSINSVFYSKDPSTTKTVYELGNSFNSQFDKKSIYLNSNSNSDSNDEIFRNSNFKYIEVLLTISTKETLSILKKFINNSFSKSIVISLYESNNRKSSHNSRSPNTYQGAKKSKQAIQAICDSLLMITQLHYDRIKPLNANSKSPAISYKFFNLGLERISLISTFLAQTYSSSYPLVYFPDGAAMYLAEIIFITKTDITKVECESALEQLLKICSPFPDVNLLIDYAIHSGFYRVLGTLYNSTGQLDLLLDSFLNDPNFSRSSSIFNEFRSILKNDKQRYSSNQIKALSASFIKNSSKLASISTVELASFVEDQVIEGLNHSDILISLRNHSENHDLEFKYLQLLFDFEYFMQSNLNTAPDKLKVKFHSSNKYIDDIPLESGQFLATNLKSVFEYKNIKFTLNSNGSLAGVDLIDGSQKSTFFERYITLLVEFSCNDNIESENLILTFLKAHYSVQSSNHTQIIHIDRVKQICKDLNASSAVAWIYLEQNDYENALSVYLNELEHYSREKIQPLPHILSSDKIDVSSNLTDDLKDDLSTDPYKFALLTNSSNIIQSSCTTTSDDVGLFKPTNNKLSKSRMLKLLSINNGCLYICRSASLYFLQVDNSSEIANKDNDSGTDAKVEINNKVRNLWLKSIFCYIKLIFSITFGIDGIGVLNENGDSQDLEIISFEGIYSSSNPLIKILCEGAMKLVDSFVQCSLNSQFRFLNYDFLNSIFSFDNNVDTNETLKSVDYIVKSKPSLSLTSLVFLTQFLSSSISTTIQKKKILLSIISTLQKSSNQNYNDELSQEIFLKSRPRIPVNMMR